MVMKNKAVLVAVAYFVTALVLTGCFESSAPANAETKAPAPSSSHQTPAPSASAAPTPNEGKKDLKISSPTSTPNAASNAAGKENKQQDKDKNQAQSKPAAEKPNYDITSPYSADKPTLMGFTIREPLKAVVQRFGKPRNTFKMDDPATQVNVYEYPGFSFGFDYTNKIVFIAVSSSDINPGLNGFRLGQTTEDAVTALGKPDTSTDYVLSYLSAGIVLKLDVDPSNKSVTSIKLFAED